jgi:HEAT repeat protein
MNRWTLWRLRRRLLTSHVYAVQEQAALRLGQSADPRAMETLFSALRKDLHPCLEPVVAKALAGFGERVVDRLITIIQDDRGSRRAATMALGEVGDTRAVMSILPLITDNDRRIRLAAIEALGKIKDPRAIEPLWTLFQGRSDHDARWAAIKALGEIGNLRAQQLLVCALMDDTGVSCARTAADLLGQLADEGVLDPSVCIGPLVAALNHADTQVQYAAIEALGKTGDSRAAAALIDIFEDNGDEFHRRWYAARSLGQIGDPSAFGPLSKVLYACVAADPHDWQAYQMKLVVAEALGGLRDERAVESLLQLLKSERNTWIRRATVEGLTKTGNPGAVRPLLQSCADPDTSELAVDGLVRLLTVVSEAIPESDLRDIAGLQNLTQNEYQKTFDDDEGWFVAGQRKVDCARLRSLAQEALSYRAG